MGAFENATLSAQEPQLQTLETMSKKLWGIDWAQHLPFNNGGFEVRPSDYERAASFIREHYNTVFEEEAGASPFATDLSAAKAQYYRLFGDFFDFFHGDELAGLLVCTPTDWSSYYIRSAALVPKYQGRRIVQQFYQDAMFPVLRDAGVERVEFDTSPANLAMMHIAARLRFNTTGTILSERWGAMVHFTKFLSGDKEDVFLQQFCAGVKYQLRDRARS